MLNRDFILSKLSPYTNNKSVLVQNQTVGDIKKGLLQWHKKYQSEYDKIAPFFKGASIEESARNVYDFLKHYVNYNIESENEQTLRSPSAIIAPGKTVGADCKNYSLFTAGILDSISRNTDQKIPLALRFASYDIFSSVPKHVFAVINPGTKHEIWVDPVLSYFDEKKQPTFFSDKKINDMPLIAMSGVQTMTDQQMYDELIKERDQMISSGRIKAGDQTYAAYSSCINVLADRLGKPQIGVIPVAAIVSLASQFQKYIKSDDSQNWNADNWWYYLWKDPAHNPAGNFLAYFAAHPDFLDVTTANPDTGHVLTRDEKIQKIVDRMTAEGFGSQITQILQTFGHSNPNLLPSTDLVTPGNQKQAGMNIWVTAALVGAGIFMISKMKK